MPVGSPFQVGGVAAPAAGARRSRARRAMTILVTCGERPPVRLSATATLSHQHLDFVHVPHLLTTQPSDTLRGHMSTLLLIPLDDTVVFPTMDVTLPVDTHGEERVLLVPRHDGDFAKVGTIARV